MSFIPSGLLSDIKKLANIEKDGQVIAYASSNPNKKKREHKHDKKNKASKKEIIKDESSKSQLPSLKKKSNGIKNNIYNNSEVTSSKDITKSLEEIKLSRNENNEGNSSSNASSASIENDNKIKNKSNNNSNDGNSTSKEDNFYNNELKISQTALNKSSSPMGKIKIKQTKTPIEAPAFQYLIPKTRVGHLQPKNNKNNKLRQELAFLYDVPSNTPDLKEKQINVDHNKENHLNSIVNDIIPKINIIPNNNNIKNGLFDESKKGVNENDEINLLTKSVIPRDLNAKEFNFVTINEFNSNDVYYIILFLIINTFIYIKSNYNNLNIFYYYIYNILIT